LLNKVLFALLIFAMLFSFINLTQAAESLPPLAELTLGSNMVVLNGETHELDVPPLVIKGTTLLPVRFVCQDVLGAAVKWEGTKKKITVNRSRMVIELWLDETSALVNGEEHVLRQAPVVQNGRMLVPLRFLSESMGLDVNYDPKTKKILIRLKGNMPPVAYFEFLDEQIRAGQQVRVNDLSSDYEGDEIVDRQWEIVTESGEKRQVDTLDKFFPVRYPGKFKVRLRVMDQQGNWSEWFERELKILPNQPPVITRITASARKVPQGVPIEFSYEVFDEEWDSVQEERWVYRWRDYSGQIHEVVGKPRALFGERTYEVALKVRDSFNNWSKEAKINIETTAEQVKSELKFKLSDPLPGEVIVNAERNFNILPDADRKAEYGGPTLLMSNSPETVPYPGIVYQDRARGQVRIFYHHKNGSGQNCSIVVWARNPGNRNVNLRIKKLGLGGPSTDEMFLGQRVAASYLGSAGGASMNIAPGENVTLNGEQGGRTVKPGEIISGMLDLECDGELIFTVAMLAPGQSHLSPLPVLPADRSHVRGTFKKSDVSIDVRLSGERPEKIILGRGIDGDHFLRGIDSLTGEEVTNTGNYGVVYNINVYSPTTAGILLNPRGAGFRGAVGGLGGNVYLIPSQGMLNNYWLAAVLGVTPGEKTSTFTYTAASGSDTPVVIAFIPRPDW